jgi:beta-mannanase
MILKFLYLIYLFLLISIISCANPNFKKCNNFQFIIPSNCISRNKNSSNSERFGFFSSKLWKNYKENLKLEIDIMGIKPSYILWYIQINNNFPTDIVKYNKENDISTVISHDLRSDKFDSKHNKKILKEIINGKWDKYFIEFSRKAKELDIEVYYRFGYEMNGNWFPWGKKPKLFVDAWCHVWRIFKKEKAENVKWIFSPNVLSEHENFNKDILPYYPGKEFVDIVSLDGYNFGDNYSKYHSWEYFNSIYSASTLGLLNLNKPMWITEIGCPSDKRREKWLYDFLENFDNSCFEVFLWFNENKDNEPNFLINNSPSLLILHEWSKK